MTDAQMKEAMMFMFIMHGNSLMTYGELEDVGITFSHRVRIRDHGYIKPALNRIGYHITDKGIAWLKGEVTHEEQMDAG